MPSAEVNHVIIFVIAAGLWSGSFIPTIQGKPMQVKPGCRYEGRRYQEGAVVSTSEPCLQCNCVEASLRCRLRVCPRIPNPPPPECHLRVPSEHVCCPEMICGDSPYEGENSLRRMDLGTDNILEEDGCLSEGVRYAAGSAMMATRRCEYCYCILGSRRCVRPKCLLPLPGCAPLYAPHSCCPVSYNCTHDQDGKGPTTIQSVSLNGCRVGNRVYKEGEMVRDIAWKAPCDNCFCAMGSVRCVPLACAPPLQGCSPIVREGQCCPSTYNCSGSIEVKATQNYASYAFVSKDYANFRKETHFYPIENQVNAILSNAIVEGRGHRIIDTMLHTTDPEIIDLTAFRSSGIEQGDSTLSSTTSSFDSLTTPTSAETETMGNGILSETTSETIESTEYQMSTSFTTSFSTETTTNADITVSARESTTMESTSSYDSTTATSIPEESTSSNEASSTTNENTTSTTIEVDVLEERVEGLAHEDESRITERIAPTASSNLSTTTNEPTIPTGDEHQIDSGLQMTKQKLITSTGESVTGLPTTILMADDIFVMNVTLRTNVSVGHVEGVTITPIRSIPPDVEAILNITQREKGEDYDYYSVPTLPPSLPNVRIIPFVAADALVNNAKDTASSVTAYPSGSAGVIPELQQRPTDSSNFYDIVTRENRFSPPVETEGGFVPRDPPYFEASYHSTDLSLEIGTSVTVVPADITNPNRKEDVPLSEGMITCRFETRQYRHGEFVPNNGLCLICMCYYGEVVCSDEKCAPLKIGCRRVNADNVCCGKIICKFDLLPVDTAESPTMVLDRADATAASQPSDGIVTPDPFRDVIKTEPAPDLPSLIEDMIPYLVERGISTPRSTTPMSNGIKLNSATENGDFEKDFEAEIVQIKSPTLYNYNDQINRRKDEPDSVNDTAINESNENGYSEHHFVQPDFPKFSKNEGNKNSLSTNDPGHLELGNSDATERISSSTENSEMVSVNQNGSAKYEKEMSTASKLYYVTTEVVSQGSGEKETEVPSSIQKETEDDEDSIYSFGHVLDFLFSETTTEKSLPKNSENKHDSLTSKISTKSSIVTSELPALTSPPTTVTSIPTEPSKSTTSKTNLEKKEGIEQVPKTVGSILKLAGCNIYGRMYRVGRIITELSGPCLECRCTEIGVLCKKLSCR